MLVSSNCTVPDKEIIRPNIILIMTGLYNFRNYEHFEYLNPNQRTFANYLQEAGYATAIAGKWQLNGVRYNLPGNQDMTKPHHFGFDEYCLWQLHRPGVDGERYADPLLYRNGEKLEGLENAYGPDVLADFVLNYIERNARRPFFIYYPMNLPHAPFVPTPNFPEWKDPDQRYEKDKRFFKPMVEYIDEIIGRLEIKLKEEGLWDNTLLIFTSDNGTHRRIVSETIPGEVAGGKGLSINHGNHVPLIAVWPSVISAGRVHKGIISFADFLPTLTDVAGIDPCYVRTDGRSFLPVLKGDDDPIQDEIFIHYSPRFGPGDGWPHTRWVMDGNYKLYRERVFYNTITDPLEKNPLTDLNVRERTIRERFESIIDEKEREFPFHWSDEPAIPAY